VYYVFVIMVYLCVIFNLLVFVVSFIYLIHMILCIDLDRKSDIFLTRSMRITRALHIIQYRFKNIHSFKPIIKENVTLDDHTELINLNGYRIILNHSSLKLSSIILILFCLLSIYLFK
jgi:hypothetical protein